MLRAEAHRCGAWPPLAASTSISSRLRGLRPCVPHHHLGARGVSVPRVVAAGLIFSLPGVEYRVIGSIVIDAGIPD